MFFQHKCDGICICISSDGWNIFIFRMLKEKKLRLQFCMKNEKKTRETKLLIQLKQELNYNKDKNHRKKIIQVIHFPNSVSDCTNSGQISFCLRSTVNVNIKIKLTSSPYTAC